MSGSRYSELVTVDVSEESFQRLTTRPRKSHASCGRETSRERKKNPNIMELYLLILIYTIPDIKLL